MASWAYSQTDSKGFRWSGGAGAALSIGIHVAAIALLVAVKAPQHTEPVPISVSVISDAPQQQNKPLQVEQKQLLDAPKLHVPQPEIELADNGPSTAPLSVSSAPAASAEPHHEQPAPTQPRCDADYLNNPAPRYPPMSRRMREEGVVLVRVYVLPNGQPDVVELKRSSGSSRLDESALAAVKLWKFVPARRGAEAVAAWVVVPVAFNLTA